MSADTTPNVFIIESNALTDEKQRNSEGEMLCHLLRMMGKKTEYRYIRTKKELRVMVQEFQKSGFRYLHMGCHGTDDGFGLTLDDVSYEEYASIVGPFIEDRRLFLSACSIARRKLARAIFENHRPYSVTGPSEDIYFSDAAVVWSSLYSLLFKNDPQIIEGGTMRDYLKRLCELHEVKFVHFGRTKTPPYFAEYKLGECS